MKGMDKAGRNASGSAIRRTGERRGRCVRGFTLLELMITVAIVAILATIAVPSYEFAMVKARRGAAQGCLTEQAQFMERYYTTHMTYQNAPAPTCAAEVGPHYAIEFVGTPDGAGYTLRIVPQGRQAVAETRCGTMSIDHTGRKTAATTQCWE